MGFSNICVIEQDLKTQIPANLRKEHPSVVFKFCETSHHEAFHKTYLNNKVLRGVKTPYAALADVDFIIPVQQIELGCEKLTQNKADFITPFSIAVFEVAPEQIMWRLQSLDQIDRRELVKWPSYSIKTMNQWMPFFDELPFGPDEFFECSMGGVFLLNCEQYKKAGYDNEGLIGWAFDDHERVDRVKKLGYKYDRLNGVAFHLKHPRNGPLALFNKSNAFEWFKIRYMDQKELLNYIQTWPWINPDLRGHLQDVSDSSDKHD